MLGRDPHVQQARQFLIRQCLGLAAPGFHCRLHLLSLLGRHLPPSSAALRIDVEVKDQTHFIIIKFNVSSDLQMLLLQVVGHRVEGFEAGHCIA